MLNLIERWKNSRLCARCGAGRSDKYPLELDHRIPRYLGGRPSHALMKTRGGRRRDWIHVFWYILHPNVQVMCHACHLTKSRREDPC
jgi:5-methylcytosine-specific restriction endonuclease McrA